MHLCDWAWAFLACYYYAISVHCSLSLALGCIKLTDDFYL